MKNRFFRIFVCLLLALLLTASVGCSRGGQTEDVRQSQAELSLLPAESEAPGGVSAPETEPPTTSEPCPWSVIGTINGTNWDKDFPMKEGADGVYTLSLELHAGEELKVRENGSWDNNFGAFGVPQGNNLTVAESGRYTVRLSYPDGNEAELELIPEWKNSRWSVIGTVNGTYWNTDFPMEELSEGVYALQMELYAGEELKVRRDGSWDFNFGGDGERDGANLVVPASGTYTVRLTILSEKKAKLELLPVPSSVEADDGWSVVGTLYGSFWDTDFPMHPVGDGRFESERLTLHAGEELKIRKDGSWDVNYGELGARDGANILVREDGDYYMLLSLHEGDLPASVELLPVDFAQLSGKILELKERLEGEYPVRIYLHPSQAIQPEYAYVLGPEPMTVCRILLDLEEFFSTLPPGFLEEIHDGVPAAPEPSGTMIMPGGRIRIFFVREILGFASAQAYMDDMSLCFCTQEYYAEYLPHEFMHLVDARITTTLYALGRDADAEWTALNPAHAYEPCLLDQALIADCFVSDYARTNAFEDKADTFMFLYLSSEPLAEADWYAGHSVIQAKVAWLTDTLRELFPSVQAVSRAVWEKR